MIYWILATLTAFFIKGLCGFANTLVFTSILSFGIVNANISPVELLIGYPSNLILVWKKELPCIRVSFSSLCCSFLPAAFQGIYFKIHHCQYR